MGVGEDFDELFDDVFDGVEGPDGLVHSGDTLAYLFCEGGEAFDRAVQTCGYVLLFGFNEHAFGLTKAYGGELQEFAFGLRDGVVFSLVVDFGKGGTYFGEGFQSFFISKHICEEIFISSSKSG